MKSATLVILLILSHHVADAQELIPYRKGELWGFCDRTKKVLVTPGFKEVNFFTGKVALVSTDEGKFLIEKSGKKTSGVFKEIYTRGKGAFYAGCQDYNKCKLFSYAGKEISDCYELGEFNNEGLAVVRQSYSKAGVIDISGNIVVPAQYTEVQLLPGKIALVMDEKYRYGYYNLAEKFVVSCSYEKIYPFKEGLAFAQKNKRFGFIDAKGGEVIPFEYDRVPWSSYFGEQNFFNFNYDNFSEGLAVVKKNDKCGYIDKKGMVAIPFAYDKAYGFNQGLAWVMRGEKWGMINKQGQEVLKIELDNYNSMSDKELEALDGISEGMITVSKDRKYGFADAAGHLVIPYTYQYASSFRNGLAGVQNDGKWGMINKKGELVIPTVYEWIVGLFSFQYENPFDNGYALALAPEKGYVLIDKSGKKLADHFFREELYFVDGLASTIINGKTAILDTRGEVLYTFPDDAYVTLYEKGLVRDNKRNCFIDIKQKVNFCD